MLDLRLDRTSKIFIETSNMTKDLELNIQWNEIVRIDHPKIYYILSYQLI